MIFCLVAGSILERFLGLAVRNILKSFLLVHCGGGQDMPGCLGPSAKLPRHFYFFSISQLTDLAEFSNAHFAISLPANPANPSCHACVIMPGRKLFRISAKIPNSKPYTTIMIADLQP